MKKLVFKKDNQAEQFFISILLVCIVSALCFILSPYNGYKIVALILLATVSAIAMFFDILPVLTASILSSLIFNYFFIPPVFDFHFTNSEDMLLCLSYYLIASVNATLTFKIRDYKKKIRDKEEKENILRLYGTIFNSLSHELKTPISTIIAAVDTLKENEQNLSENHQHQLLNEIGTASIRLNGQVENLLSMSRIENNMIQPHNDWFDINELIYKVRNHFDDIEHDHFLQFEPRQNLPLFKLDAGLLEQVLYNLIINAIQYTPKKSTIKIEAKAISNRLLLKISDNGKGFPQDELENVFNKFYRLPKTKAGGTGLGLSIVKGFTEVLGGTVVLFNNENGGATFTIEVPSQLSKNSYLTEINNE